MGAGEGQGIELFHGQPVSGRFGFGLGSLVCLAAPDLQRDTVARDGVLDGAELHEMGEGDSKMGAG